MLASKTKVFALSTAAGQKQMMLLIIGASLDSGNYAILSTLIK